ncbi:MAG: hypothetical protein AB1578_14955 [Thermodesulfobacteriota bacterium]
MSPSARTHGAAVPAPAPEAAAAWARAAEEGAFALDAFSGASETEFAAFGGRVQACLAQAEELARSAAHTAGILGDAGAADRLASFRGNLTQLAVHGEASRELAARMGAVLDATAAGLGEISPFAHSFQRSVRTLRNLGVATLMESARPGAGGAEFAPLAADVQHLGERISRHFSEVLLRTQAIGKEVGAARSLLGASNAASAGPVGAQDSASGELRGMLAALDGSDALLAELGARAAQASAGIRESSGDLAGRVGAILTNLQTQDATRQKLEHVRDSLRLLARSLREPAGAGDDPAGLAAALAGLQRTQLRRAREEFGRAMTEIEGAVRGVTEATYRFDAAVAGLASGGEPEGEAGATALGDLEERLRRVAAALGSEAARSARVAEALSAAAGSAQELTAYVGEIEEIGLELELVAVNAITRASRTGALGRPLAVIAREIQRQSAEARRNTGQVAARLSRIAEGAREIETLARSFVETAQAGALRIAGELQCLVGTLGGAHARFVEAAGELRCGAAALDTSVAQAVGDLSLPGRLESLAQDLERRLEEVEAEARAAAPQAAGKTSRVLLEELSRAYTMESQREIHRLLAGDGDDGKAGTSPGWLPPSPGSGDLGANVELF